MQEEIIRDDEYVDICPNCGGLFSQNAKGRRKRDLGPCTKVVKQTTT